jgi:hypothetical protein
VRVGTSGVIAPGCGLSLECDKRRFLAVLRFLQMGSGLLVRCSQLTHHDIDHALDLRKGAPGRDRTCDRRIRSPLIVRVTSCL